MERIGNKISYIRKPLAKYSFVSAGLMIAAYIFAIVSVALSYQAQGNAPMISAALGLCSIITAISSLVYGVFSFFEKEKNYILARICLIAAGILAFFWLVIMIVAL